MTSAEQLADLDRLASLAGAVMAFAQAAAKAGETHLTGTNLSGDAPKFSVTVFFSTPEDAAGFFDIVNRLR